MTKLNFPEQGLIKLENENLLKANNKLKDVLDIKLSIPSSLSSKSHLTTLPSKIDEYLKNNIDIEETMKQSDNNIKNLDEKIRGNFSKLNNNKITKRTKLI